MEVEPVPSTSHAVLPTPEVHSEKSMDMEATSGTSATEADTPRKVKLKRQVSKLSRTNLQKTALIRNLQKQVWSKKRRIFKLTSVVKELKKTVW